MARVRVERFSISLDGYLVTGGIEEARQLAREAANGKDVRIGGGAQTIRQGDARGAPVSV